MKRALFKNRKTVLVVAGIAVAVLASYFAVVAPQRSKASELRTQIASAQSQLATLQVAAAATNQEQARVADVVRLSQAMPRSVDIPDVLLELNTLSTDTGIEFQTITPGTPTAGSGYTTIPISLVFQGDFYNLDDFLLRLRDIVRVKGGKLYTSGRLYTINSLSLAEGKDKFPQVQATLTVDAYVYGTSGVPGLTVPTATTSMTSTGTTTTGPATTTPSAQAAGASGG